MKKTYGNSFIQLGDCIEGLKAMLANSVNAFLFDPPYKYLKNQALETDFNEDEVVRQIYRVAMQDASLCFFGRGSSFARLQKKFADYIGTLYKPDGTLFGNIYDNASEIENEGLKLLISNGYKAVYISKKERFLFKESIIWDKRYCSSPVLPMSRVHEDAVIFMRGAKTVNKVKIPYLEMKKHDLKSIVQDINRIKSALGNTKSLNAMKEFLENNRLVFDKERESGHGVAGDNNVKRADQNVATVSLITNGANEKTLIAVADDKVVRTDFDGKSLHNENGVFVGSGMVASDRGVTTLNLIENGGSERTLIRTDIENGEYGEAGHGVSIDHTKFKNGDVTVRILQMQTVGLNEQTLISTENENETEINSAFYTTLNPQTIKDSDKAVKTLNGIENGLNEKSLVRTDFVQTEKMTIKFETGTQDTHLNKGDRSVTMLQTLESGMNEQSLVKTDAQNENYEHTIIEQIREHYGTLHPTQKPVRLMERIILLISNVGETVCDIFCGAGATGVACVNTDRNFIGFEIYDQPTKIKEVIIDGYFTSAYKRFEQALLDKEVAKQKALQEAKEQAYKEAQKSLF